MESEEIVKGTFKARKKQHLDNILETLRKSFGEKNIIALSPSHMHEAQIYVLDMDIKIERTEHSIELVEVE
jgi:hypothetical protein